MTLIDYMVAAIALGIVNSFNPYMLSMILCFVIFVTIFGNTQRQVARIGQFTVGTVFFLTFFLAWRESEFWLERPLIAYGIYFLSLGVAVLLLITGYLLLRQWWQSKRQHFTPPLPSFLTEGRQTAEKNVGIAIFSVILGLAVVLVNSLWPKDQANYVLDYFLFASGNVLLATLFFALHALSLAFFLWVVWKMLFHIKRSTKLRADFGAAISWLRICFSAICIAVGFGLIYLFVLR